MENDVKLFFCFWNWVFLIGYFHFTFILHNQIITLCVWFWCANNLSNLNRMECLGSLPIMLDSAGCVRHLYSKILIKHEHRVSIQSHLTLWSTWCSLPPGFFPLRILPLWLNLVFAYMEGSGWYILKRRARKVRV